MRSRYSSITKNGKYVWTARILLGVMSIVLLGAFSLEPKGSRSANLIDWLFPPPAEEAEFICGLPRDPDE